MVENMDRNFEELCSFFSFTIDHENSINDPWGITPPRFVPKVSWDEALSNIDIPDQFTDVKDTTRKFKAKIDSDICIIIGGGKSVQYFNFHTLDTLRSQHKSIYVVACNGGSMFYHADLVWLSNYVRGETFQWRCFKRGKKQNSIILQCGLIGEFDDNKEYDWIGYTPYKPETYRVFASDIKNCYMARSGSNSGFFAIKFCLMIGFKNVYLIGFDGMLRSETFVNCDIYRNNWCGPLHLLVSNRDPNIIDPGVVRNVVTRNEQQIKLFNYVKKYCAELNINLKWLTPTIYIADHELSSYYLSINNS